MADAPQQISMPQQQEDELPTLEMGDNTETTLPPDTVTANTRSQKADIGLSQIMQTSQPEIYNKIAGGKEQQFRSEASSTLNFKAAMQQEQALMDAFKKKGSALSPQEALNVVDPMNPGNKPANPIDVIERAYATNYISSLNTADGFMRDTVMSQAANEIPEQLEDKRDTATGMTAKLEVAKTLRDDLDNEIGNQGWVPWAVDQAKMLFQPYNEWKLRGNDPDVGRVTGGVLLGDNVKAQADDIWMRPTDEAVQMLHDIVGNLKQSNPTLARQWLNYFIGQSSNERLMDNMFTILMPSDYAAALKPVKGTMSLIRKIDVNNRAGVAFKQMVENAAKQDGLNVPLRAVAQEAAGDIQGAAATRATENITKLTNGTLSPIQDTKESLMSGFRLDGDHFDSQPGNLSREELTRYKDSFYNAGSSLYNVIQNVLKVIRTPEALRSEDAVRAYMEAERARYTGLENALLDISSPYHMRETNTYWTTHTFGNEYGRLFSDPETASNWAKARGFAEPKVVEATGAVETKPSEEVGTARDFRRRRQLQEGIEYNQKVLAESQDTLKTYNSRKFIGPKQPDVLAAAQQNIENIPDVLTKMKSDLDKVSKRITTTDPVIDQNGVGYKVQISRPYREDDPIVRQWAINSSKSKSSASFTNWDSWKNSWLGWVRSADDTLAFNESVNRKIANYTQSALRVWAKAEAKSIEDIANRFKWYKPQTWLKAIGNKQMFEEFHQALRNAKDMRDPVTKELGYFFRTPGELQDYYQRWFQRLPTDPEMQAYFSHVKILEANRVLSEIAEFRNRARIGAEQHQIYFLGPKGERLGSGYFDGIEQKEFPGGSDQILIVGGHKGDERLHFVDRLGSNYKKYKDQVDKGVSKLIRIYDPDARPLKGWSSMGDNRIRYVLVSDSESKPLGFNHINRRGGGHFDVDSDWYVKQARMVDETAGDAKNDKRRIVQKTYTGDWTFSPVENKVMGHDIAGKMTRMNGLMKDGKIEEAKALAQHLGIDWERVEGWYKPKTAENGHVIGPPDIDWHEPFYVVPRNKKIFDIDKSLEERHGTLWRDGTKSGSDAQQYKVAYSEARDSENLMTFQNSGTHANPIYKYKPATYVDPIPSLNRAMNRAISSTFMDDYKIHAVEQWIAEATPYLKATEEEVRAAPFWHFNNADRGAFKPAADLDRPGLIDNLLSNRFKIRQFVGMPNKVDTYIHGATQLLVDQFYKKYGSESERSTVGKAFTVVPLWALSKVTDSSALRSFAFNAKLGLFSLPQFLVQSQTFANIWAISPRAAPAGTLATMLHTWARINRHPEVIESMDRIAQKFGLRPGDFKEANAELAKTGFEHVGGEYMLADDQMQHRFIRNQWGNFLDAGQVFFKEGERSTRTGAYYTSFFEWRRANPTAVLTDADRAEILQKADLLTNNMSRASASAVNSSLASIPTQFLNYQIRLGELFLGKRLGGTTSERIAARARLLGFYSALYGVPSAIGVSGYPDGAIPFVSSIREFAINHGYVVGDNQLEDIVMNGLPAWTMAMASGGLDYRKGNQYNVGDRYGSQGLTVLRESMRSDETVWKLLTGAAGSTIGNTIASFDPVWQAMKYLVSDDEEGNYFKMTSSDLNNIFSEISSVDSVKRMIYAMHTGRWLSHNEQYIEDVTGLDTLYRTLTGLHSQQQDDIFSLHEIKQQEEDAQKAAEREIVKDYHRGIQATADKDDDTAKMYFTRARARMIAAGIPLDRRAALMSNASRDYEPQIETSVRNWATKNVPYGQEPTRMDAYQRFLQLQDYRNK